jgi:ribosomal protein S18 acetylase RimI-like enzyme
MTPTALSIRHAVAGDGHAILDCLRCAFEPYRNNYTPAAFRDTVLTPGTIADRLASMSVLVAVATDGAIVGTIASQVTGSDEGHLRGMAVLPQWQAQGVADRLLAAAERELCDRHCSRVTLDTTEPLRRAVRFLRATWVQRVGPGDGFLWDAVVRVREGAVFRRVATHTPGACGIASRQRRLSARICACRLGPGDRRVDRICIEMRSIWE